MINHRKLKYLFAGVVNTVVGYCLGLLFYKILSPTLHIIFIAIFINIINISFSFVTYKIWVFKSKASWWQEYFKSYMVYGAAALINIALIWVLVDGLNIPFWIAQAILILFTVVVSYLGHSKFTFANKTD